MLIEKLSYLGLCSNCRIESNQITNSLIEFEAIYTSTRDYVK
jgi:hypothetical protein